MNRKARGRQERKRRRYCSFFALLSSSRFVPILKKIASIINIKSLDSEIIQKIVLGDINRRSQFLYSPIQVARNRPNHTRREPIVPVDCAETSLLRAVQLAPRHILAVLKIGGI